MSGAAGGAPEGGECCRRSHSPVEGARHDAGSNRTARRRTPRSHPYPSAAVSPTSAPSGRPTARSFPASLAAWHARAGTRSSPRRRLMKMRRARRDPHRDGGQIAALRGTVVGLAPPRYLRRPPPARLIVPPVRPSCRPAAVRRRPGRRPPYSPPPPRGANELSRPRRRPRAIQEAHRGLPRSRLVPEVWSPPSRACPDGLRGVRPEEEQRGSHP